MSTHSPCLGNAFDARLAELVRQAGNSVDFYINKSVEFAFPDIEETYLAVAVAERVEQGKERVFTLEESLADLGL